MKLARVAVAAAVVLALASAWHSGAHMWRRAQDDYRSYASYTPLERTHAAATVFGLDGSIFDFYADYLVRGDRFYVQVDGGHDPKVVRMFAGYYLLPAVEVGDPSLATVVISYWTDPSTLGIRYLTQRQAGLQPIFVSRISAP